MSILFQVVRGLMSRAGSSAMTLIVAIVAVAAATAGPTYYGASQTSILQDGIASAPVLGRGFEAVQSGAVSGTLDQMKATVSGLLDKNVGGAANASRLFQPPVYALESTAFEAKLQETIGLAWRSGACSHLRIQGACPSATGQVIISRSLARTNGWHTGQKVAFPSWRTLSIVGIYTAPAPGDDYWFTRYGTYFPTEYPPAAAGAKAVAPPSYDGMFTPRSTMEAAAGSVQGDDVIDEVLAAPHVRVGDATRLSSAISAMVDSTALSEQQIVVTSVVPVTLSGVQSGWTSLEVPVLLISAELIGLAWLLLFLLVTEAVDARGPEVALAKLRGHGRLRTVGFGVSEPVVLLAVALPVGALAGWGATALLSGVLLRHGTPVGLPWLGWVAAAVATAGGLAAVALASQRTLRRPVVEQWRRASRHAGKRAWALDAVLLTGSVAGLLELFLGGQITSARNSGLSLLVPGLLGLAVAVVASRVLPVACRAAMHAGGRAGGLASFLALRHVARRPGGVRTTIMLATSFALATFAVAAWSVVQANHRSVARAEVGAPAVLTVTAPPGQDLDQLVAKADPSGRQATVVDELVGNGSVTMAVDPAQFARIADSIELPETAGGTSGNQSLPALIAPKAPPPLILDGDSVRVTVGVEEVTPPGSTLSMDVDESTGPGPTPVALGALPASGTQTFTAPLVGCPCLVQDFTMVVNPLYSSGLLSSQEAKGSLSFSDLQVHGPAGWAPVGGVLASAGRWTVGGAASSNNTITATPAGLTWKFLTKADQDPTLSSVNRPSPMPAIASAKLTGSGPYNATGVDGNIVTVDVVATPQVVPGAPSNGVVIDRNYAYIAANYNLSSEVVQQVWLAAGARSSIEAKLRAEGVKVISAQDQSTATALLDRQGPGLASVLFLAEAGAAALLAGGGAILGLYLSGRRRRYEYAALEATGLTSRTLLTALAVEQLVVLAFGLAVGIATGVVAAAAVIRDVPEFLVQPAAPALSYVPPITEMGVLLAIVVAVVVAATLAASVTLVRGVRLEQLREAPA
ncbi:MAG: FtsX-like permease family protein [Acidimicrobiales bacterium]